MLAETCLFTFDSLFQLKTQEDEITNIKSELAIMELEVQVFIS